MKRTKLLLIVIPAILAGLTTLAEPAKVKCNISTIDFEIGAQTYDNRNWTWTSIPKQFQGAKISRRSLGDSTKLKIRVKEPGTVYIVTGYNGAKDLEAEGWKRFGETRCCGKNGCEFPGAFIMCKECEEGSFELTPLHILGIRLIIP